MAYTMGARDGENAVDVVVVVVVAFAAAVYTDAALSLLFCQRIQMSLVVARNALVPVFHCCFAILIANYTSIVVPSKFELKSVCSNHHLHQISYKMCSCNWKFDTCIQILLDAIQEKSWKYKNFVVQQNKMTRELKKKKNTEQIEVTHKNLWNRLCISFRCSTFFSSFIHIQ